MKTKQISALAAMIALTLVFANINMAFADYKNYDGFAIHALEKKQAKEAKAMTAALKEYQKTLKPSNFDNKVTEKRVNDNIKSISSKITGIVAHLAGAKSQTIQAPSEPTIDIIQVNKLRSTSQGGIETARVIYKVTAGQTELTNAKIVVESSKDKVENTVKSLLPTKSSIQMVFVKAAINESVIVRLVQ